MGYQGIFFDIGWTLMRPRRSWFFSDIFYALAAPVSEEQLERAATAAMPILDHNHRMDTRLEEEQQFEKFYQAIQRQLPELSLSAEAVHLIAHDKVYNYQNYIFFDDVRPVLERLKHTYRLGIISDTWPSAEYFLKENGLYELFDSITFSCQLGVFKPDQQMYQHALQSMALPAEQTIFVDDSLSCLRGAMEAGITPIQMCAKPNCATAPDILAVGSMTELEQLLKDLCTSPIHES